MSPLVPKGPIYKDDDHKLQLEARNGYIQAQYVLYQASEWNAEARVTPDLRRKLHELAVNQIFRCAGHLRDGPVGLSAGKHEPPPPALVPSLVEEMCAYVNENWSREAAAFHLAAYVLWRVNWIHPFCGGNGRTARALSYLILLCARIGFVPPSGAKMMPDLIVEDRDSYYVSLRAAEVVGCGRDPGAIRLSRRERHRMP